MANQTAEIAQWYGYFGLACSALLLLVCVLGLVGNLLSAVVFLQPHFRTTSINILLAALSFSDACFLLLAIPVYCSGPIMAFWKRWFAARVLYTFSTVRLYPAVLTFHCFSAWMLISITLERFLAVCKPMLVRRYCGRRKAVFITCAMLVLCVLQTLPRFWDFGINRKVYLPTPKLRTNDFYMLWYGTVGTSLAVYLIPLLVVIILNSLVALEIRRSRAKRRLMTTTEKNDHRVAYMMLFVVITFVCCYSPTLVLHTMEVVYPLFFHTQLANALCQANTVLLSLNSASTFIFYYKFSSRYRTQVHRLMTRIKNWSRENSATQTGQRSYSQSARRSWRSQRSGDSSYHSATKPKRCLTLPTGQSHQRTASLSVPRKAASSSSPLLNKKLRMMKSNAYLLSVDTESTVV